MKKNRSDFEKYILGIEIPEDLSLVKEGTFVADILNFCSRITPTNLFRYRTCTDNHIEAFTNDQLFLTKPTKFNDPFDALLFIDKSKILEQLFTADKDKSFNHISKLLTDENYKNEGIKHLGKEFIDRIIENSTINGQPIKLTDEYVEFQMKYNEHRLDLIIDLSIKSLKQASLVACLSESIDSILMWSHYSSNHTGFALNYDFNELYKTGTEIDNAKGSFFFDKKLFPVIYTDKRYDATQYAEFHFFDDFYRRMELIYNSPFFDKLFYYKSLLFKSKNWEYENEWRIIKQTNLDLEDNKPDFVCLEKVKPKEIYLGYEISPSDKDRLIEIAKEKNLKILQMQIDNCEKEYKLKYYEIK